MDFIREMLTIEHLLLLDGSLPHILVTIDTLNHHAIKNLNFFIMMVLVYDFWKERNAKFHNSMKRDVTIFG